MDEKQTIQRELIDDFLPEAGELVQRVRRLTVALMDDPQNGATRKLLVEDLDRLGEEAGFLDFDSLAAVAAGISRLLRGAEKGTVYPELLSDLLSDGVEAISQGFERLRNHDGRPLAADSLLHRIEVVLRSRDTDLLSDPAEEDMKPDSESLFDATGSIDVVGPVDCMELAGQPGDETGEDSPDGGEPTPEGLVANLTIDPEECSDDDTVDGESDHVKIPEEGPVAIQSAGSRDEAAAVDKETADSSLETFSEAGGGRAVEAATDRIDRIIDLADELVLERDRLLQLKRALDEESDPDADVSPFFAAAERVGVLANELRHNAIGLRGVPAAQIFASFSGLVGEFARIAGKEVKFVVTEGAAAFDRLVVEEIGDLLVNLIRNAVAYGIEEPEVRSEAGKSSAATLSLSASQQGAHTMIRMTDDGGGLDLQKLRASQGAHPKLRILSPGFEDIGTATQWRGLGVGIEVIEAAIARLNGSLEVQSDSGRGTEIIIRLPRKVATIQGIQIGVGSEQFVLPRSCVVEVVRIAHADAEEVRNSTVILAREKVLSLIDLDAELGLDSEDRVTDETYLVVVRGAERQAGVIVDSVEGYPYAAVHQISDLVGSAVGIGGATILEDGRVRLILDLSVFLDKGEPPAPDPAGAGSSAD